MAIYIIPQSSARRRVGSTTKRVRYASGDYDGRREHASYSLGYQRNALTSHSGVGICHELTSILPSPIIGPPTTLGQDHLSIAEGYTDLRRTLFVFYTTSIIALVGKLSLNLKYSLTHPTFQSEICPQPRMTLFTLNITS
ncbi:hypothetical protein RSOLAG1IB_12232 [Rhizoctonia solani AG-1 IB]|uniref:Uncharacterized protein n=1 Tax=Thanatephorus cucumeris (strain AG1-IB / isolate 7/3/14) TaxID=1108050 RepID=A0A0B7FRU9_THACB|nr:hypothetical protein RSOLAG1IB_12232 [Rhizoctonia solani AG-1 IB]